MVFDAAGVAGYPQNGYSTEQPTAYHRHAPASESPLLLFKSALWMSASAATLPVNALPIAHNVCMANMQATRLSARHCFLGKPDCK